MTTARALATLSCLVPFLGASAQEVTRPDFSKLEARPANAPGVRVADGKAVLTGDGWTYLTTAETPADVEVETVFTIQEPARSFGYFGQHWSVWPDLTYGDRGFEAGMLLRGGDDTGYRVQLSHRLQEVALVKFPSGGYLRSVPCPVKLKEPHRVAVTVQGPWVAVRVDGRERIRYRDGLLTIPRGRAGVGVSSGATVSFETLSVKAVPAAPAAPPPPHVPNFSVRNWLGGRPWVFDGEEPILLLPTAESTYINNVKLRPGFKPLLSWNSHWDVQTQGAFKEADNAFGGDLATRGGGKTLTARWTFRHVKDRFVVRTRMDVGYDARREVYAYDVESELEVLPGEPFHFRYGYDFEHHTPLDPFRWQYLILRRQGGQVNHRPVYPIDPGPQYDLEQSGGARVWYGRHNGDFLVAPAVEYDLPDAGKRKLHTAVCAAFYDTGVAFGAETAPAGTRVKVKYRYTGWPAEEAEKLFKASTVYDSPTLDPNHHWIFAEGWPKVTFDQFVPLSQTWIYGRRPFLSGHNQRPTYALAKAPGIGAGFAMKLGPGAYGAVDLPAPSPLPNGRTVVSVLARSINTHGPGGRVELEAREAKTGKVVKRQTHYLGNGTWDWKRSAFVTDVPGGAQVLHLGLGNAGTGELWVAEVAFTPLPDGAAVPPGVLAAAAGDPPKTPAAPPGAVADYRMEEGSGLYVLDGAGGPFGMLQLANLDWTVDEGRPALRFADNASGRREYARMGTLEMAYLRHSGYAGRDTLPVALAGMHGGGFDLKGLTVSSWVKPAARMGGGSRGDVVGVGARRFILALSGREAPYRLSAAIDVNDSVTSDVRVDAGRWTHVAMTCEATPEKKWRVRLYVDGTASGEGTTQKFSAPASLPPSLILGAEIFYFHDSYYRGLIGRTTIFDRALGEAEIRGLARK